jgi:hypothetical protein
MEAVDFFIAHAGPDRRQAQELLWLLEDENCRVFLDRAALAPGDRWPSTLRDALQASRATVVLISTYTDAAFYEQEEIARAIQLARQQPQSHAVIPVMLERLPDGPLDMPYGTGILQALDATRAGGLERVAHALADWLGLQGRSTVPSVSLPPSNYRALGAALRLDRYPQWSGVLEESARGGHLFMLLHGPRQQNVGLFVERIQRYFTEESRSPHAVYRVRFSWEGVTARCGADWLRHLRLALGGEGHVQRLLDHATRNHAIFVVLGLRPLDRLDVEQQKGLQEFLEQTLPDLLRQARPTNDVRMLLALDYEAASGREGALPPLVQDADNWGRQAQASGQLRYRRLPPVELPQWRDVEHYLEGMEPAPLASTVAELKREYERLTSGQPMSYQEMADMIDRYVQDA